MFTIIQKKNLTPDITLIEVFTPRIASALLPGQFVTVKPTGQSREIALPVYDYNTETGTVSLLVQVVDASTGQLAHDAGISILYDMQGPLGKPSDLAECNDRELSRSKLLFVAGGTGAATALFQLKWLHSLGCRADVIVSAKTKNELLFIPEFEKVSRNVYLATDDGSVGFHGSEAQLLELLLDKDVHGYDLVTSVGSLRTMKAVSDVTLSRGIPSIANFMSLLTDNTGQSAGFRINVAGEIKDVANDGPEFNAHQVDFGLAVSRLNISLKVATEKALETGLHAKVHEMAKTGAVKVVKKQA